MAVSVLVIVAGAVLVSAGLALAVRPGVLRRIGYDHGAWQSMAWYPQRLKFLVPPIQVPIIAIGIGWMVLGAASLR